MRCDVDGNLWMGWGMGTAALDGVAIFNPDGRLIGRIDLPERCANLCFGGTYRNRLFIGGKQERLRAVCEYAGRARRLRP